MKSINQFSLESKKEACGVIGVYDPRKSIADKIFYGLMALQHRGQESSGIAVTEGYGKVYLRKAMGLVGVNLSLEELLLLSGRFGIGHVRYSTSGKSSLTEAQPFNLDNTFLAYNGNIVNYRELKDYLTRRGVYLVSSSDTEVMLNILTRKYEETGDFFEALSEFARIIEGAYSATLLTDQGELLIFRDPHGFRPLCWGKAKETIIGASESVAVDVCGGSLVSAVQPGEALLISNSGVQRKWFMSCKKKAHCMFEYVYFSRPDSIIEGKSVYATRVNLGKNLAKNLDVEGDVIVPVPDTSRPATLGMSLESGVPAAEGLIKNRYIYRTFIMPRNSHRENAVKLKLNPLKPVLKDKKVILVDDSIVRGTTIGSIVRVIKEAGAREVHVRVTCPPVVSPCFYGIDIATHKELIASRMSIEEIGREIGADSLQYQTIEGLVNAIGFGREDLCMACLTGNYPTPKAQRLADQMKMKPVIEDDIRYVELGIE